MAVATTGIVGTPDIHDDTKRIIVIGKIAPTAGPDTYAPGGLAFDLPTLLQKFTPVFTSAQQPLWIGFTSANGYAYQYDPVAKKLIVKQGGAAASSPAAEIPTAAIPAGVSGDTITFLAFFKKFQ